jgi:hypothetical protein
LGQEISGEMLPETIADMKKITALDFNHENRNNKRFSEKVAKNPEGEHIDSNLSVEVDNDEIINRS